MKLRKFITKILLGLVYRLERAELGKQYKERVELVGSTIYTHLPALFQLATETKNPMYEHEEDLPPELNIIEGGSFNYFELPSGKLPKFDFVCPQIPLYVYIGGPETASFEVARTYGFSKDQWEKGMSDLEAIEIMMPKLASTGKALFPRVIVIKWDETCTAVTVAKKIDEALNGS